MTDQIETIKKLVRIGKGTFLTDAYVVALEAAIPVLEGANAANVVEGIAKLAEEKAAKHELASHWSESDHHYAQALSSFADDIRKRFL